MVRALGRKSWGPPAPLCLGALRCCGNTAPVCVRGEGAGGRRCPQARGGWFRVFGVKVESFSSWASRAVHGKFCRVRGLQGCDGCRCCAGPTFLLLGRQRPEELPVQRRSVRMRRCACPSPSSMASPALPGLSTGPWKIPLYYAPSAPPHPTPNSDPAKAATDNGCPHPVAGPWPPQWRSQAKVPWAWGRGVEARPPHSPPGLFAL
ncbi:unnamed protein product [Rangifer tarandus platyrhynchus]|uniref:Uncharacterized protein n=2 Tax=Rangifer tarandus platyrhynchus TaxID=3082113 RepID=A0ABN8YJX7_RANTA|nr:unnamed protein product [Rangifer tarandus platyrhynchus]